MLAALSLKILCSAKRFEKPVELNSERSGIVVSDKNYLGIRTSLPQIT